MQQVLTGFEGINPMTCSAISGDIFGRHDRRGHPECHDRLVSLLSRLPGYLKIHEPEAATQEDLERVHVPGYLTWLKDSAQNMSVSACPAIISEPAGSWGRTRRYRILSIPIRTSLPLPTRSRPGQQDRRSPR